jgi:hypothetical protein
MHKGMEGNLRPGYRGFTNYKRQESSIITILAGITTNLAVVSLFDSTGH